MGFYTGVTLASLATCTTCIRFYRANKKGVDQTGPMRKLVWTFVVNMQNNQIFLSLGPFVYLRWVIPTSNGPRPMCILTLGHTNKQRA